jgi:hypothetical protein
MEGAVGRKIRLADAGPARSKTPPRRNTTAEINRKTFNRLGMMDLLLLAVEELYNSLLTGIGGLTILREGGVNAGSLAVVLGSLCFWNHGDLVWVPPTTNGFLYP